MLLARAQSNLPDTPRERAGRVLVVCGAAPSNEYSLRLLARFGPSHVETDRVGGHGCRFTVARQAHWPACVHALPDVEPALLGCLHHGLDVHLLLVPPQWFAHRVGVVEIALFGRRMARMPRASPAYLPEQNPAERRELATPSASRRAEGGRRGCRVYRQRP